MEGLSTHVFTNFGVVQKLTPVDVVVYVTCPLLLNKHAILILDPKINALAKIEDSEPEDETPPPEPVSAPVPPPKEDFASESEPRLTRREVGERPTPKYRFVHGVGYIEIK